MRFIGTPRTQVWGGVKWIKYPSGFGAYRKDRKEIKKFESRNVEIIHRLYFTEGGIRKYHRSLFISPGYHLSKRIFSVFTGRSSPIHFPCSDTFDFFNDVRRIFIASLLETLGWLNNSFWNWNLKWFNYQIAKAAN